MFNKDEEEKVYSRQSLDAFQDENEATVLVEKKKPEYAKGLCIPTVVDGHRVESGYTPKACKYDLQNKSDEGKTKISPKYNEVLT